MKNTLRYLLIVMGLVSVLSINAQSTAQLPEVQMHSTSIMVGSGSNLPQAAATGAYVTGETPGCYSPAHAPGRPRKSIIDDDEEEKPAGWDDPYKDPIGDAMIPLMLLALAYVLARAFRSKRTRA